MSTISFPRFNHPIFFSLKFGTHGLCRLSFGYSCWWFGILFSCRTACSYRVVRSFKPVTTCTFPIRFELAVDTCCGVFLFLMGLFPEVWDKTSADKSGAHKTKEKTKILRLSYFMEEIIKPYISYMHQKSIKEENTFYTRINSVIVFLNYIKEYQND